LDRCLDLGGAALTTSAPQRHDRPPWLAAALAAVPIMFLLAWFAWPVGALLARGLRPGAMVEVLTNPGLRRVAWFTVWQAAVSTVVTLVAGLAPAWVLARFRFPGRRFVRTLVMVPFVLPTVVVGAAFLAVAPDRFDRSVSAIVAAHVFFNVAVVVRTVGGLWEQLDPALTDAARTLGAGPWAAFRQVTLPLLWPAVMAAGSIVFLFTVTSFGVVRILGGPGRATVEVEIYLRAAQLGDLEGASALAALQLVAVGGLLAWWSRVQRRSAQVGLRLGRTTHRRPTSRRERWAVTGIVAVTVTALMIPLVALVARSVRVGNRWTLAAWRSLGQAEVRPGVPLGLDPWGSVVTSLRLAAAATTISVGLGLLAALAIAQARRRAWLLDTGIMLPLGTSAVTIGFGIVITYDTAPLDLRSSVWIVPLVHALVAVPFVVRTVLPVLRSVPDGLLDAAATLGAPPWQVWRRVELPLIRGAIFASAGFAFAVSLGEFGATSFLTRRGSETLPVAIDRLLGRTGDLIQAQGFALATMLLALTVVAVAAVDGLRPLRGGGW
jgi:thiamine transport system permease protein